METFICDSQLSTGWALAEQGLKRMGAGVSSSALLEPWQLENPVERSLGHPNMRGVLLRHCAVVMAISELCSHLSRA